MRPIIKPHTFINYYKKGYIFSGYFICTTCNLIVYMDVESILKISSHNDNLDKFTHKQLNLTCDDVLIKSIIE